ncbi:MGMT family protein [Nocardioides sp. LHG3406-4]|uniref:MGMT family protein n=1 Tax=Nocardioides sp. LHG3406-4 TaxID=2804575 RepID=UPI003CEC5E3D
MTRVDPEDYAELVLSCVEQVPWGRVTTYGSIAEAVGRVAGGGGPRQVGAVMAAYGGPVPWWRVVRADGSLPPSHQGEARQAYLEEATPMRPSGSVDLAAAFWPAVLPVDEAGDEPGSPVDSGPGPVHDTPVRRK